MNLRRHIKQTPKIIRNNNFIWTTIKKQKLHLYEMGDSHIHNCILLLQRKLNKYNQYNNKNYNSLIKPSIIEEVKDTIKEFENELAYRNQNNIFIKETKKA